MRIYQCDCCNKVIADPYTVKMKEFYVGVDTDCLNLIGIAISVKIKRKIKIYLCDDCYKSLHVIAEKKKREKQ